MIGYFCISDTGRQFLYVPFNLFAYDSTQSQNVYFRWEPDFLSNLNLLLKENKITQKKLEDKEWEVYGICIPDKIMAKFRRFCIKKNKKKCLNLASRIFDWIEDSYDFVEDNEDYEEYEASNEDYSDDWWLRGDEPPFYSGDEQ